MEPNETVSFAALLNCAPSWRGGHVDLQPVSGGEGSAEVWILAVKGVARSCASGIGASGRGVLGQFCVAERARPNELPLRRDVHPADLDGGQGLHRDRVQRGLT